MDLTVSLEKVADGQFKAKVHTGAPFEMELPLTVENGTIAGSVTAVTIAKGSVESSTLTVTRTTGTTDAVTVNVGTLPSLPANHRGYKLVKKSDDLPLTVIVKTNAPVFASDTASRSIAENTVANQAFGDAIIATDADTGDTLTYSLEAHTDAPTDVGLFDIDATTGQLKTKGGTDPDFNFESDKTSYTVVVKATDSSDLTDTIDVTINVTDINEAPTFPSTTDTTFEIAENTAAGENIGDAVAATDPDTADGDTDVNPDISGSNSLTYSIDATSDAVFDIDENTGQLKTEVALDYETTTSYTVTVTASDGEHSVSIDVTVNIIDVDEVQPTVTITGPTATQHGKFDVTISFSESVTGFEASDISLTGTASATATLAGSGTTYTANITPTSSGNVVIQVPADAAEDGAGNGNTESQSHTVAVSLPAPTVTITGVPTTSQNSAFDITIAFSETVTGFAASDISLGNDVSATVSLTGSGTTYTATITPAANVEEQIVISVPAGAAQNAANTDNTASTEHRVQLDTVKPSVTLTAPSGTQTGAFNVTITFSETVTGFVQGDISLSGTATATVTSFTGSGRTYTAEITPTTGGSVNINVDADVAEDTAGNGNIASETLTVLSAVDRPDPIMYVKQDDVVQHSQTVAVKPFELIIKFGQPVTGFEQSDLRLSNSNVTITGWVKSEDSKKYTVTVTPTGEGSVTFTVPANVAHAADDGQGNVKRKLYVKVDEDHDPAGDETEDETAPHVRTIQTPSGIQSGAFDVTITFSESVTGFTASDITLGGTANARVTALTGSGSVYTATITPDANAEGNVMIQVPAGAVKDEAENENPASRTYSVRVNLTRPTVEIINVPTDPQNSAFDVTIIFSDSMTGFEASDIRLGGTANATVTDLTGSRSVYTATITPTRSGTVTIQVRANAAQGSFNRRNTASETHSVTVDLPSTTVTISVPSSAQNGAFDVTITFSKSVTGFTMSDITLSGTAEATVTALTGGERVYTATITPTTSGNVLIQVPANAARDSGDHGNIASSTRTVSVNLPVSGNVEIDDSLDPIMYAKQSGVEKYDQTVAPGTFQLIMDFGQPVTGFERSELGILAFGLTVTITGWQRSSNREDYIATVRVSGTGSVTFTVPENAVQAVDDGKGNPERKFLVLVREAEHSGAPMVREGPPLPNETLLFSNYPNPFNPETWIPYQLAQDADVQILIYDVHGTIVRRLTLGHRSAGFYTSRNRAARWDGRNSFGEDVANGVYFYQLHAGDISPLRRMLMLK